jgi:hypothetical protein
MNLKGVLLEARVWNFLIRRIVQPGEWIYASRWLLWTPGTYRSQVGKQFDPYALVIFKYFNYIDLLDKEETMAARLVGMLDEFFEAVLIDMYVEDGCVSWASDACHQRRQKVQCDFRTGLIGAAHWIKVPHPFHWRYLTANNGESSSITVASWGTLAVSIQTFTTAPKYNNGMSMFIISFFFTIKQPYMSSIEVSIIQNHFIMKNNMVKLQHLCSSAFEMNIDKDSQLYGCQPMFVESLITPTVDSKNRENERAPIVCHMTNISMKDAVNDFTMLLDFLEETSLHILIIDKYNEPSHVKRLKLKMMTAITNESNTCEMLTEFCEDAAKVDIPIARKSNWVVVKMVLQQCNVNVVVPVIQFFEMGKGYVISKALKFATTKLNSSVRVMPWDPGKLYAFMAKVICECYWRNFLSIYSLLNWIYGRRNHFHPLPTGLNEESQLEPEPEEALETRWNASREVEVLVTGKGLPCFENSWKLAEKMRKEFPGFLLEVKESFKGGGIDSYAKVERTCGKRAVENHFLIWKTHDLHRWKREKGKTSTI